MNHSKNRVVGFKQTRKAIKENRAQLVYLAEDIDQSLFEEIKALCQEKHVKISYVKNRGELGRACGIDTKAATAAVLFDH